MSVEESVLVDLEKKLGNNLFIKGGQPSLDDAETFGKFINAKCVPDQDKYPSVWAWYSLMVLFEDEVIKSWKACGGKEEHHKGGKGEKGEKCGKKEKEEKCEKCEKTEKCEKDKKGKKHKKGKKEEKPEEKVEEEDLDLFGEETKSDEEAKEAMKKKNKEKKKEKKKEVDKSHVILEVKGWEADQDLEALAKKIISTIKKDGLSWNTGCKFEEVAFGIKKLIIALLVEDEKCSVQEIVDELEQWEDEIQSVEIVSFNKA